MKPLEGFSAAPTLDPSANYGSRGRSSASRRSIEEMEAYERTMEIGSAGWSGLPVDVFFKRREPK